MQKQISTWRKELSLIAEPRTVSDNGKLKRKRTKILQKYIVNNSREVAQLKEALKQKLQAQTQRIRCYEKRENWYSQNELFKEDNKRFYKNLGMKNIEAREPSTLAEAETNWKSLWGEEYSIRNEHNG